MLEWAITLPNMGIEIDLKQTPKTSRSLLFTAKANALVWVFVTASSNDTPPLVFPVRILREPAFLYAFTLFEYLQDAP